MKRRALLVLATGALAGCLGSADDGPAPRVAVQLTNADDVDREVSTAISGEGTGAARGSAVLPPGEQFEWASFGDRAIHTYSVNVASEGGAQTIQWDIDECDDLLIEGEVREGEPSIDTSCRS